jgi:hypothetical protein
MLYHKVKYLLIYGLFNDGFNTSDYVVSNDWMIVNNKIERKHSWFNVRYYPSIVPGGTEEGHEKSQSE